MWVDLSKQVHMSKDMDIENTSCHVVLDSRIPNKGCLLAQQAD